MIKQRTLELVENNMKLVPYTVHTYFKYINCNEIEDYMQEGYYHLILAADKFDSSKGFKFSTFAVNYICNGLKKYRDYSYSNTHGIHMTSTWVTNRYKLIKELEARGVDIGNADERLAVMEELGYESDALNIPVLELDREVDAGDGEKSSLVNVLSDNWKIEEEIEYITTLDSILNIIKNKLNDKDARICTYVINYYTNNGSLPTWKKLAKQMNMAESSLKFAMSKAMKAVRQEGIF